MIKWKHCARNPVLKPSIEKHVNYAAQTRELLHSAASLPSLEPLSPEDLSASVGPSDENIKNRNELMNVITIGALLLGYGANIIYEVNGVTPLQIAVALISTQIMKIE